MTTDEKSMSERDLSGRFVTLPDDETLERTRAGLERRGFGVEVADTLDEARDAVLARIPQGSAVMTFPSVTLQETGIAHEIDERGRYDSARSKVLELDRATQMQEIKTVMALTEYALGSVHAITYDGLLVIASALGSNLAAYAWGAAKVVLVVGAQKIVPDIDAAHERIEEHCLKLEDARAREEYGQGSRIGKLLTIHQEEAGRIHVVLIRRKVGY